LIKLLLRFSYTTFSEGDIFSDFLYDLKREEDELGTDIWFSVSFFLSSDHSDDDEFFTICVETSTCLNFANFSEKIFILSSVTFLGLFKTNAGLSTRLISSKRKRISAEVLIVIIFSFSDKHTSKNDSIDFK